MKGSLLLTASVILLAVEAGPVMQAAPAQELKGPITETQGTTLLPDKGNDASMAGLGAPGANAVMTQDMLLVSPANNQNAPPPQPLTAYIGMTLKIDVERRAIEFKNLHGLEITVTNDTTRPLVIDGDSAVARLGDKTYKSAPLTALQLAVSPEHGIGRVGLDLVKIAAPAAATIGALPTIEDLYKYSKPPINRYGRDQQRRVVESSRFGKRILWPHEKTQGIVYFETGDALANARVEIPVITLFDTKDTGTLISSPAP